LCAAARRRTHAAAAARSRVGGRVGAFPQPFGVPADAAVRPSRDDRAMSNEAQLTELADRQSDDLCVALMWARRSRHLWVTVTDHGSGEVERIDPRPDNALDVFHHPFAYVQAA
jgi:hypothetical protein